jgi:[FeFe] hydrogenase H-cluster maturation GTPase HydF
MTALDRTPRGERLHLALFGRRNAGKSRLINALTRQEVAIVSDVPGTTTDPVSKAMEILPLGPVLITDTPGLDDSGPLGGERSRRGLRTLVRTDLALLLVPAGNEPGALEERLVAAARAQGTPVIVVASKTDLGADQQPTIAWAEARGLLSVAVSAVTGAGLPELLRALRTAAPAGDERPIVGDLVQPGDVVVLVVPIDQAAPKGRLILPQALVLRDLLDHDAVGVVVRDRGLRQALAGLQAPPRLVITDSQAFAVAAAVTPRDAALTSFSIVMARHRGDLGELVAGTLALPGLRARSRVLVSEACTHHRQQDDIGSVQIPRWLRQVAGGELALSFASGRDFPDDLGGYDLVVQCGGCAINRRELLERQRTAREAGVPMTNYGLLLAWVHGLLPRALEPFPQARQAWDRGQLAPGPSPRP